MLRQDVTINGDQNNDGQGVVLSGGDMQRILRSSGTGTDVSLVDITLTDGRVEGEDANGGGVFVGGGSSLTLTGCTVQANDTDLGVDSDYSGVGGGIFAESGSRLAVTSSAIIGNGTYGGYGAGIATGSNVALVVRDSLIADNNGARTASGGGIFLAAGSSMLMEGSTVSGNGHIGGDYALSGGGLLLSGSTATISRSTISGNEANRGGGIAAVSSWLTVADSTIATNRTGHFYRSEGGGVDLDGSSVAIFRNSTITGNRVETDAAGAYAQFGARGGGFSVGPSAQLDLGNCIVAGNSVFDPDGIAQGPDIFGNVARSNGHNVFGSDVAGNVSGDREGIAASAIFAALDPDTGGGLINGAGVVLLLNSLANPALSGADLLAAPTTGQLGGARPLPAGSLPDIGSLEINHALSTTPSANNDVLTGTAAANAINGLAGNDYLKGLGGADTLHGNDGGDLLDGGAGNDKLFGDAGIDLVFYGGTTKVTIDLSGAVDTAKRGSETDTLSGIEGAIGSSAADTFKGDALDNLFQGGGSKDTATGGAGRDLYDFNTVADSKAGAATRDVITDFAHLSDKIDVTGLDADTTVAGNQAFHWVGTAALTGPGEIGYFTTGGNTIIRASTDGDAASEFEIQLTGIRTLTAVDFYL